MTGDPVVRLADLGRALGIQPARLRAMQASGHIPRPAPGTTTLLAALRGYLAAVATEAKDRTAYRVPEPPSVPPGSIHRDDLDRVLDQVAQAATRELRRCRCARTDGAVAHVRALRQKARVKGSADAQT